MTTTGAPAGTTVRVTVVHAPACHFCDDARSTLQELADRYPLEVELVEADSPRGRGLLAEHRAGMFPLVVIDGAYFSAGRLPCRKLRKLLDARTAAAVA
jgi:thiol-disulfide isomerase/thioredoxin